MGVLRKQSFPENLETYAVLVSDTSEDSIYFRITDLPDTFSGGKNSFLIQGSDNLVQDTLVKIEIKDSKGNVIYTEPGEGIPEYYEGTSKPVAVYVYPDTAYGPCTITILAELAYYLNEEGVKIPVPANWQNKYNVRWQKVVNVNPNLSNTSKIRFYRRPKVDITETILPVYTRNIVRETISGSIDGVAVLPSANSNLRTYRSDTLYELYATSSIFSASMEGETISVTGLNQSYSSQIRDVVNDKKLIAVVPYYETSSNLPTSQQIVKNFTNGSFELTYNKSVSFSSSSINTSYAKIKLTDLEAFSGDPARLKIFAKRKADIGNFTLLEDIQLEAKEILYADAYSGSIAVDTGIFSSQNIIDNFWLYSNYNRNTFYTKVFDNTALASSVKLLDDNTENTSEFPQRIFFYSQSIDFTKDTEYQLDFLPLLSSSLYTNNKIEVYLSGSAFFNPADGSDLGKKILVLNANSTIKKYDLQQINFKPEADGNGSLLFAIYQGNWQLSNISLMASEETNFSPNEITLNVSLPTVVNNDEYEFKFEFYDINNNYVPVIVTKDYQFVGGSNLSNVDINATASFLSVRPDSNIFPFGYNNNYDFNEVNTFASTPIGTKQITFSVIKPGLVGNVTFVSAAFDSGGVYIDPSIYAAVPAPYPGLLTNITSDAPYLSVENFTGSIGNIEVKRIEYTASLGGYEDKISIFKVVEGTPGSDGTNGTQYIIKPISGTAIKNSDPNTYLELQLTKIDASTLTSVTSGNIKLVTGSLNTPISVGNGITAGTNGVLYNPRIYAQKINGSLTVGAYDFDQNVLVDTITLADITDGLTTGFVEASNGLILNRNPSTNTYTPTNTALTASFYDSTGKLYTSSILITPSYSSPDDRLEYQIGINDPNINLAYVRTVAGVTMNPSPSQYATKGLTAQFRFTEPNTGQQIAISEGVAITANGTSGTAGAAGTSGTAGATGTSGTAGATGTSGTNGTSGIATPVITVSPASQVVNVTTAGVYATPVNVTTNVVEEGTSYTYDDSIPYANSTFRITDVVNGTNNNNGTITPATPTTTAGLTTTFNVRYITSTGVASSPIAQSHVVSVALTGSSGPGIVFTGIWESGRAYQYENTRRDVVLYSTTGNEPYDTYYATKIQHTADNSNKPPNTTYWESLGTEDIFVAAKIAIFEESFIKNTLNVGASNNGGISSANITIFGSGSYPYISLGQSSLTGSQGYGLPGIFLGAVKDTSDSDKRKFRFSLVSGSNFLKWDGTGRLEISGTISASEGRIGGVTLSGNTIYTGVGTYNNPNTPFYLTSASSNVFSLGDKLTWNGSTLFISGAVSASAGAIGGVQVTTSSLYIGTGLFSSSATPFFVSSSGRFSLRDALSFEPTTGLLTISGAVSASAGAIGGVYIDRSRLYLGDGIFSGSTTPFFISSSGRFSLRDALSFEPTTGLLTISGTVSASAGAIGGVFIDRSRLYLGDGLFTGSNTPFFVSSSGRFSLKDALAFEPLTNRLFVSGAISASAGQIGPVNITTEKMFIGTGNYESTNTAFFVSSSGDFSLKDGLVWNSSTNLLKIKDGEIRINATGQTSTIITAGGLLSSQGSNVQGNITATSGQIGGWSIVDDNLEATGDTGGKIKINADRPSIEIYSGSSLVVDISADTRLSSTGSVNINVSGSARQSKISSGSRVVNTGNIASSYSGLTTATFTTGSNNTFMTASWSASFVIPQSADGQLITLNFSQIAASGSASSSFNALVESPTYLISDANFSMKYGFSLYSASAGFTAPFTYIDRVSKTGIGTNVIGGTRSSTISGSVQYDGSLTLSKNLNAASYSVFPFVEAVTISVTATEPGGGGCGCPSAGTIAYYGDCVLYSAPSSYRKEIWKYNGTCDNQTGFQYNGCDVYLGGYDYDCPGGIQ